MNRLLAQLSQIKSKLSERFPGVPLIGFVSVLCIALLAAQTQMADYVNYRLLDKQFSLLQAASPGSFGPSPVLIGIDEATSSALPEPTTLWHHHFAKLFNAVAEAKPAVVGLQIPLPIRSYAFIAPGYDKVLTDSFANLNKAVPVVVGLSVGNTGRVRKVFPDLLTAGNNPATAITSVCADTDDVVRRFDYSLCNELAPLLKQPDARPFAVVVAEKLSGKPSSAKGLIDYAHGGQIRYLPMIDVLREIDTGNTDKLKAAIAGRPLIIGTLLPTEARYQTPTALAGWEPSNHNLPTTLIQFQALRSLTGSGMVSSLPGNILLLVVGCLFWFKRNSLLKNLFFFGFLFIASGVSLYALHNRVYLPTGMLLLTACFAFISRFAYDAFCLHREKDLLRSAFEGYVSPKVMREILHSGLKSVETTGHHPAVMLYADIRGFTARCGKLPSEQAFVLLNQYFAEAVAAIHSHGGAVDRIIGDGIMASFGLPQTLPHAERNALEAAQDLLLRLELLNQTLVAAGEAALDVGIGIHRGEVAAGYVGGPKRRDYTLIGDVLNQAVMLEGLGRKLGYPVICSHNVATQVDFGGGLVDLGEQSLPGQASQHVWGWQPPVLGRP